MPDSGRAQSVAPVDSSTTGTRGSATVPNLPPTVLQLRSQPNTGTCPTSTSIRSTLRARSPARPPLPVARSPAPSGCAPSRLRRSIRKHWPTTSTAADTTGTRGSATVPASPYTLRVNRTEPPWSTASALTTKSAGRASPPPTCGMS